MLWPAANDADIDPVAMVPALVVKLLKFIIAVVAVTALYQKASTEDVTDPLRIFPPDRPKGLFS